MRREDREPWPSGARASDVIGHFPVTCLRQKHTIYLSRGGLVYFSDHSTTNPRLLLNEFEMRRTTGSIRGCYLFAELLLSIVKRGASHHWAGRVHRSRRTSAEAMLHAGGLPDQIVGPLIRDICKRHEKRMVSRTFVDEYSRPFHEVPEHRTWRMYRRIRKEQDEKLARVVRGLKEAGFEPIPVHYNYDWRPAERPRYTPNNGHVSSGQSG